MTYELGKVELYELELESQIEKFNFEIKLLRDTLNKNGWQVRNPTFYQFNLSKLSGELDRLGLTLNALCNEHSISKKLMRNSTSKDIITARHLLALGVNFRDLKKFFIGLESKKLSDEENMVEVSKYFTTLFNITPYIKRPIAFSVKSLELVGFSKTYFGTLIRDFPGKHHSTSNTTNVKYIRNLFNFEDKLSTAFGEEVRLEDYFDYIEPANLK